ncbi:MAG: MBL fold metallo-hydrolase [Nitrososphaerales archaeon]
MQTFALGEVKISVINLGDLKFKLKDEFDVKEEEYKQKYYDAFETPRLFPSQSVLVSSKELNVLVDAGDYELFANLDPSYSIQNYSSPPKLLDQLSSIGISSSMIDYVIITHAHLDHFVGSSIKDEKGEYVPTFPNARYLLGKLDYEDSLESLRDKNSMESKTLGVLLEKGKLELLEGDRSLTEEIDILQMPGETRGHQVVKVNSKGQVLYCVGDLFHDGVEVENPSWMAKWNDKATSLKSREKLISLAIKENALVLAAHMPLGRIEKTDSGQEFVSA